jgi:hypothetical protein
MSLRLLEIVPSLFRWPSVAPREIGGLVLRIVLCLGGATAIAVTAGASAVGGAGQDGFNQVEPGPSKESMKLPTLSVRGLVIDATTKRPIARFRVIPGVPNELGTTWQTHLITTHKHGLFELPPDVRAWDETRFRVEAKGYRPGVSRVVKKSEGEVKLTFALEADTGISAVVHAPDGAPAKGAQAAWATLSHEATGIGATITLWGVGDSLSAQVVTADAAGRFRLPTECDPGTIVVAHQSGYAEIKPADLMVSKAVTLHRWCRVEGRLLAGKTPVAGQKVRVYRIGSPGEAGPTHTWQDEAITDASGRFACEKVVQGRLFIDRVFSSRDAEFGVHGLACLIEVREGQTTRVRLGGPGRTLVGRLRAPKDLGLPIDWSRVRVDLGLAAPHIGFPGDDAIWASYRAFLNSEEGKAYFRDHLPVGRDGSFRIESVPPGEYSLSISVLGPAVGRPAEAEKIYAATGERIEVSPIWDERGDPLQSVGTINLRKYTLNP